MWFRRSKICHPDKAKDPRSTEAFQKLALAYETLSDDYKCSEYVADLTLKMKQPHEFFNFDIGRDSSKVDGMGPSEQNINLAEALGLFASVALQFHDTGVSRSFFDKAADAISLIDLYMKRKEKLNRNNENHSQRNRADNNNDETGFPLNLQTIATGVRVVGAVAAVFGAISAATTNSRRRR